MRRKATPVEAVIHIVMNIRAQVSCLLIHTVESLAANGFTGSESSDRRGSRRSRR